ncbi:MAG TPA: hypothetical protein VNX01_16025 [Bacteroidia bacterium]|nr:hypothetical protein [Bacteroidia bacterium]
MTKVKHINDTDILCSKLDKEATFMLALVFLIDCDTTRKVSVAATKNIENKKQVKQKQ